MVRPSVEGPLFCHYDTKSLTRDQFTSVLKQSLAVLGYKGSNNKLHPFKIGMATSLLIGGYADDDIKTMPPKRQSSYGVAGAIKKMKSAAQRKKTSTAIPSGPSIPPNNATLISPDVMEELTNRVTERVASRMERRMEEIFDKIASKNSIR
ncbi:Hypothetical predicted protein [Mytilus galloprovincialis]|uniref:Uncharacterized protein n=1 Tax=Mytilus galloprovincialis TaxID=29158 RepID=A0A8B6H042_MYTGA|nr:Hypothetical predicted protein [Mytilus galloprovincialis]